MTRDPGRVPAPPRRRAAAWVLALAVLPACLAPRPLPPRPEIVPRPGAAPTAPAEDGGTETVDRATGRRIYIVRRGDTLWSIAAHYHVPLKQLIRANGIDHPEELEVGTRLRIPDSAALASLPPPVTQGPALRPFDGPIPTERDWHWPLAGVPRLLSRFSTASPGIDLEASRGEAVLAARTGAVVFAGEGFEHLGTIVLLDHGGGVFSLYGYLESAGVTEGTLVRRGESIGRAGSSGAATSPRLHFRILQGSLPQDPLQRLPSVPSGSG